MKRKVVGMFFLYHFFACSEYNVDKVIEKNLFDSGNRTANTDEEENISEAEPSSNYMDEHDYLTPDTTVSIWTPTPDDRDLPETNEGFDPSLHISPSEPLIGNVITILMTLSDDWMDEITAQRIIDNSIRFVTPVQYPRVLIILDDNHNGEDVTDPERILGWLQDMNYDVDMIPEPVDGISASALHGYHVVIFSNPGQPVDDVITFEHLRNFSAQGFGVIFQGDDITRPQNPIVEEMTRLRYIDNGTTYYGSTVDNHNGDAYEVWLVEDTPISNGISGSFLYGNDIDTTVPKPEVHVFAWCTIQGENHPPKPVIAGFLYEGSNFFLEPNHEQNDNNQGNQNSNTNAIAVPSSKEDGCNNESSYAMMCLCIFLLRRRGRHTTE